MLQRLSLSEEEYARYVSTRTEIPERPSTIQFVRVKNESAFPDPVLEQRITVSAGDSFSAESIGESVESLYNLGPFSSVSTERVEENGKSGLVIRATEKPWYDQYMRVGLGLEEDFEGESFYNLAVALRRNDVGFNGGFGDLKLRLGHINALVGEFSDPFISGSDFYYSAEGLIDRRSVFFRGNESEEIVADYRRSREQLTLSTGYGFYQTYTAKAGIRYGAGEIKRRIGSSDLPNVSFDIGDAFTSLVYDSQDDADFPEYGTLAKFTVTRSLEALGSSADFTELGGELVQPISFGSTRLLYRGEFAVTDGNRPAGRVHTLGGFLDLSGYTQSSLAATSFHIHRLTLLEALDQSTALLGYTLFGGASFEISSLTSSLPGINDRGVLSSGSVFVGANTPLLPVYLGVGMAEAGNTSLYLVIGRITSPAQRFDGG
jgi:NTE family protein